MNVEEIEMMVKSSNIAGGMTSAAGIAFACIGAAVTWLGKAVGGYLGDVCGKRETVAVSIVGSTALCFMCTPEQPVAWLALLFVSQLAMGPVLSLMYERAGRAGGSAFGLNCLGLFEGGA